LWDFVQVPPDKVASKLGFEVNADDPAPIVRKHKNESNV
jgi:hypothetical protein